MLNGQRAHVLAQFEHMVRSRASEAKRLPTYRLYGESGADEGVDWLHCESIADRSRLHNWEIRPHRHEALTQFLYVSRGRVQARVDASAIALTAPALVIVPPLVAHGFIFQPPVDGTVVTTNETHLAALLEGAASLRAVLTRPRSIQLRRADPGARALSAAAAALRADFQSVDRWRSTSLDGALMRLAVAAARVVSDARGETTAGQPRAFMHVERFKELVERQFRLQPSLAAIAGQIGITSTQLNRVCRQVLGHSALGLLHARIVLEAKRDLTYTMMSVKQIAHEPGFDDAAYFTRFFQRETKVTPTEWRARAIQ